MHTSPSDKVYIGITSQEPSKRWGNGCNYSAHRYFYAAIKKYGWENFKRGNGVPRSAECREKIAKAHCKAVLQFTKDGIFIQEYSSIKEASILTGAGENNISRCCLGKCKTANGFVWKHKK